MDSEVILQSQKLYFITKSLNPSITNMGQRDACASKNINIIAIYLADSMSYIEENVNATLNTAGM